MNWTAFYTFSSITLTISLNIANFFTQIIKILVFIFQIVEFFMFYFCSEQVPNNIPHSELDSLIESPSLQGFS